MQMDIPVEEVVVNDGIVEQSAVQSETVQNEEYELTRMPNETEQLPPKQETDDRDDETIDDGEIPPLENGGQIEIIAVFKPFKAAVNKYLMHQEIGQSIYSNPCSNRRRNPGAGHHPQHNAQPGWNGKNEKEGIITAMHNPPHGCPHQRN